MSFGLVWWVMNANRLTCHHNVQQLWKRTCTAITCWCDPWPDTMKTSDNPRHELSVQLFSKPVLSVLLNTLWNKMLKYFISWVFQGQPTVCNTKHDVCYSPVRRGHELGMSKWNGIQFTACISDALFSQQAHKFNTQQQRLVCIMRASYECL